MNLTEIVVQEITDIMTVFSQKGRTATVHNRKTYGLSFCEKGQITYAMNGKTYVSDNKHIILLPQGQHYTLYGDKTGEFALINFTCAENFTDTFLRFPVSALTPLINDFQQLKELHLFPENRAKLLSIFYNMLHNIAVENTTCKTISPAIEYIEKHYGEPSLSNTVLAKQCNISEVYLRKLFNRHLNTTPGQYVSEIRLQKAKQLLAEGTLKIRSVSEECGFSNPYHFSRFFKQYTGMSPTEYSNRNKTFKL